MRSRVWLALLACGLAPTGLPGPGGRATAADPTPAVGFNRDVKPILSDNCYACHGPDKNKRKADLRLDTEEGAFADLGGYRALVPGKPGQSELYRRITEADRKKQMPPAKFGKALTPQQVETIRRWIAQGAKWQKHWSLIPPERPALPPTGTSAWPRNAIDHFILARL